MAAVKFRHGVLLDLSGTIHIGDELIGNSKAAIEKLIQAGVPFRFVTNTTKEAKVSLVSRLEKIGLKVEPSQVFTSLTAARTHVENERLKPYLLLHQDALQDFDGIICDPPNSVVVGLAPDKFDYETMNTVFRIILDGAPLIAIHKARYYKTSTGLSLGPGPFVSALEYATGVKAITIGKPDKTFFTQAIEGMGCDGNSKIFMIGDDVKDDIDGSQTAGMLGILVKTGKYLPGDELTINPPPYKTVDSVLDAIDHILHVVRNDDL